ncbi:LemA family protein [Acidipropionibacterium acidipropionici]|jgi:LemA protein|uniref:LemA family protein n=2 Tax=Acidipropionibacterium acidipropionici TaxID=1748 RepID=A0ABN4U6B5_9ACTN|nr:LemA family protein [Acidipropionibacterium acidipropionici]AFV88617.1 LemA family protein [Acidipropionibacterium acidipropionici ATCC 4875]AOZ47788.1 LemA family protein [Acidipropionibacterium acidipropionici]AZP38873.1 LemA family protein [Acidipropionibacterium acidipropionici]QCV95830.1 LemA family protein [Acidipropionibacterium acidipropionici]
MALLIILIILLVVIGGGVGLFIAPYNSFVKLRNTIQESWRQVDVELNRRYELIPNLVETVRAAAAHERNTLEEVTRLRNQAVAMATNSQGATPDPQRAQIESQLSGAVHNLVAQVEAYPELRTNANFLELQRELSDTEDRIANGRRYYNANVKAYNTKTESFPSNLVAGMFHFEKASYFQVDDPAVRQAPGVNFGEISQRPEAQQNLGQTAAPQIGQGNPTQAPGYAAPQQDPGQLPDPQPVQQPDPSQQAAPSQQPWGNQGDRNAQ